MSISHSSVYEPLTEQGAISLAVRLGLFREGAPLVCREIGDGNLNLVFRIVDKEAKKGIIIKQALPYAKVVGESWPLTLKRAVIESNALRTFAGYAPQYVPKVYYSDESLAITVMEDLSRLQIARKGLIEGKTYPLLSQHIGEFIAKTLFYTSDFGMNQQEKNSWRKALSIRNCAKSRKILYLPIRFLIMKRTTLKKNCATMSNRFGTMTNFT